MDQQGKHKTPGNKIDKQLIRATFVLSSQYYEKIKNIAFWERMKIQDVMNNALKEYIESYEQEKGEIKGRG